MEDDGICYNTFRALPSKNFERRHYVSITHTPQSWGHTPLTLPYTLLTIKPSQKSARHHGNRTARPLSRPPMHTHRVGCRWRWGYSLAEAFVANSREDINILLCRPALIKLQKHSQTSEIHLSSGSIFSIQTHQIVAGKPEDRYSRWLLGSFGNVSNLLFS